MIFKIIQNCLPLYQWHHTTFYVKKNHLTKHFNRYNESIIIDMECDAGFLTLQKSDMLW
jgi:hypothetical protein